MKTIPLVCSTSLSPFPWSEHWFTNWWYSGDCCAKDSKNWQWNGIHWQGIGFSAVNVYYGSRNSDEAILSVAISFASRLWFWFQSQKCSWFFNFHAATSAWFFFFLVFSLSPSLFTIYFPDTSIATPFPRLPMLPFSYCSQFYVCMCHASRSLISFGKVILYWHTWPRILFSQSTWKSITCSWYKWHCVEACVQLYGDLPAAQFPLRHLTLCLSQTFRYDCTGITASQTWTAISPRLTLKSALSFLTDNVSRFDCINSESLD